MYQVDNMFSHSLFALCRTIKIPIFHQPLTIQRNKLDLEKVGIFPFVTSPY
jgi:signal-transduction protein with cAMP-binding, CBS, and nucleotidyltransferase domain